LHEGQPEYLTNPSELLRFQFNIATIEGHVNTKQKNAITSNTFKVALKVHPTSSELWWYKVHINLENGTTRICAIGRVSKAINFPWQQLHTSAHNFILYIHSFLAATNTLQHITLQRILVNLSEKYEVANYLLVYKIMLTVILEYFFIYQI